MNLEEKTNKFLKSFFEYNYPRRKLLFENIENIYALMTFLDANLEPIEIENIDIRDTTRTTLIEAEPIIDRFYESIGVNFKLDEIIKNGVFDIIKTNSPVNATDHELTYGNNNYINNYKSINIYNNGLITDTVIWVHEISHYRNQPDKKEMK